MHYMKMKITAIRLVFSTLIMAVVFVLSGCAEVRDQDVKGRDAVTLQTRILKKSTVHQYGVYRSKAFVGPILRPGEK